MDTHSTDPTITRRSLLLAAPLTLRSAAPQIGFCIGTYGMRELPIETAALRLIASVGYDGVELALMPEWQCDPAKLSKADFELLRTLLRETRLALPAMNDVLFITASSRGRNLERLRLAADLAHFLVPKSPPVIETTLGGKTADWPGSRDMIAEELRSWTDLATQHDVTDCFKPHTGQAIHNSARALEMLRIVNSPRLKICYDYCRMFAAPEPLESSLRALAPHIGFITLKDARRTDSGYEFCFRATGIRITRSIFDC